LVVVELKDIKNQNRTRRRGDLRIPGCKKKNEQNGWKGRGQMSAGLRTQDLSTQKFGRNIQAFVRKP